MQYRLSSGASNKRAIAMAIVGAWALIGTAAPSSAQDIPTNQKCRGGVGSQLSKVVKAGMGSQDKCHAAASKAKAESTICNQVDGFPFTIVDGGKYAKTQDGVDTKLQGAMGPLCPPTNDAETLDNYPGGAIDASFENIDSLLTSSSDFTLGEANLGADKVKTDCMKAISKARQGVTNAMVKQASSCQKTLDKAATALTQFNGLSRTPDCLDDSSMTVQNAITKADTLILTKCGTSPSQIAGYPSGNAVGSCSPLPSCVSSAALAAGKNFALAMYPAKDCAIVPPNPAGRTVKVSLASGIPLGGADVRLDYPRFQSGIPENGAESEVQNVVITSNFFTATDKDGALDVSLAFSSPLSSGEAFQAKLDTCQAFSQGLCSVTTAAMCQQAKDCAPHCLEVADGGTENNTNHPCQFDSDCKASGPVPGLIQKCVCPTCTVKHCIGPNSNPSTNSVCNFNTECSGRCASNPFNETGGSCTNNSQCPGSTCIFQKACSSYTRSLCSADADCNGTNVPTCTAGKCTAGPLVNINNACTLNSDCAIGQCTALNSLHMGRACSKTNANLDCGGHCSVTTATGCSATSQCPGGESCVFGTCDTTAPITSGLCNVGNPTTGGGFCTSVEACNSQTDHCSTSQYLTCGKPGDPACPAGESCVTQGALTKCTVLNAFDEFANEVDGVTCSINVTEP